MTKSRLSLTLATFIVAFGMAASAAALPPAPGNNNPECQHEANEAYYWYQICSDGSIELQMMSDEIDYCEDECELTNEPGCFEVCDQLIAVYNQHLFALDYACNESMTSQAAFEACLANYRPH